MRNNGIWGPVCKLSELPHHPLWSFSKSITAFKRETYRDFPLSICWLFPPFTFSLSIIQSPWMHQVKWLVHCSWWVQRRCTLSFSVIMVKLTCTSLYVLTDCYSLCVLYLCACACIHLPWFPLWCVCDPAFSADFSPPASPLSVLFPPRECFGEVEPMPVWDWSTAWVEELEAQFKASREARRTPTSSRHSGIEHWRGHLETPSHRWSTCTCLEVVYGLCFPAFLRATLLPCSFDRLEYVARSSK